MKLTLFALMLSAITLTAGGLFLLNSIEWRPPTTSVSTPIPNTSVVVELRGPDMKGHYWYDIHSDSGITVSRFIGPVYDRIVEPVLIKDEADGNIRVQWGTSPHAAFCIFNIENGVIVGDANAANPSYQPFRPSE